MDRRAYHGIDRKVYISYHDVHDIKNNIDKITKNRQQNLSEIRQQRQMFQDQVKQMRVKITSHLDTLEHNILQELDDTENRIKSKIEKLFLFFVILSILFLISVKFCSMLSINVDVLDVLIISRIDKSPTQSLWFVEIQHGQKGITTYADHWCPECDEGLCSDCETHHNISKASRNHGVISIENYHKLPSSISEIGNRCEHHDMKYTLFCQFHDKPFWGLTVGA
jgi:hypothetical protein